MKPFFELLAESQTQQNSLLCVGLDPELEKLPPAIRTHATPLFAFNRAIIDATAQFACAFKPQIAHYAAVAAEDQLHQTIAHIKANHPHLPVILDAKRGDIGATAKMYAREAFDRYQADAVTINPYLGGDSLTPFLNHASATKGVFILCRTSNPDSGLIQQLPSPNPASPTTTLSVAQHVAAYAAELSQHNPNIGLVVGATHPQEMKTIRQMVGDMPLLAPGIGAQGGDLPATLTNGLTPAGNGLLINISRAILYARPAKTLADAATSSAAAAEQFHRQINHHRNHHRPTQTP